jgi:hypothetical protein
MPVCDLASPDEQAETHWIEVTTSSDKAGVAKVQIRLAITAVPEKEESLPDGLPSCPRCGYLEKLSIS